MCTNSIVSFCTECTTYSVHIIYQSVPSAPPYVPIVPHFVHTVPHFVPIASHFVHTAPHFVHKAPHFVYTAPYFVPHITAFRTQRTFSVNTAPLFAYIVHTTRLFPCKFFTIFPHNVSYSTHLKIPPVHETKIRQVTYFITFVCATQVIILIIQRTYVIQRSNLDRFI